MSGALDSKARATTEKLLKKFGKVAQFREEIAGVYDPDTGSTPPPTINLYPITVYIDKASDGEISSGLVLASDTLILVSAKELGIIPQAGHDIIFSDKTYQIKSDLPIYSGELVALHRLVCVIS
jgi:hypothetical protein